MPPTCDATRATSNRRAEVERPRPDVLGRYLIIHNPISGVGRAGRRFRKIATELEAHGHTVDHRETRSKDDAIAAARKADPSYDALISVGGDGTHNSVINGLMGRPLPLLPVPAGTENLLCKAIDIPSNAATIRSILEAGHVREIDIATANGQAMAVMSGVGIDAQITGEVHAKRHGPISRWWYFWPTLKNLFFYKWPHLEIEVDGRVLAERAAFAIVGNMRLYADRLQPCLKAVPDDGLLDVCIFVRPGAWRLIGYFLSIRRKKHLGRDDVAYAQGKRIVVRPAEPDVPYQIDGDAVGTGPIEYVIQPKAIRLLVPAP
jgi:diacylglycerol kinase (ATP)